MYTRIILDSLINIDIIGDHLERTLIILKPEVLERGLIGQILIRFEQKEIKICAIKLAMVTKSQAIQHYAHQKSKPFFGELVAHLISGPVVLLILEGPQIITIVRKMVGATLPINTVPGTIRGDFSSTVEKNIIHASDSLTNAEKEIALFFYDNEII